MMHPILNEIPMGRENAISRAALAAKLGIPDRAMRKQIEAARADGHIILNSRDGGYYRTDNMSEINRYYKQEKHRAKSIFRSLKAVRSVLKAGGYET